MNGREIMNHPIIEIVGRVIGDNSPTFVIAEAASNHMCDIDLALKMVDEAKAAGADAIKFQTYKAERLVIKDADSYWKYSGGGVSQFEYYKKLDRFGRQEYEIIFKYARQKGLVAFSTPFDLASATMLNELGAPLFKIASCDLPDVRLLRHVAASGKPIILSTGASELWEIEKAVSTLCDAGNSALVLLVCTLSYPTSNKDAHINRIKTFKQHFSEFIIGISDHTEPDPYMIIPAVAVAAGAKVIEKHFTLDRSMTGSGHAFSVSPADLEMMVKNIRLAEEVLGDPEIKLHEAERPALEKARRSLVAERAIKYGEVITSEMVGIKRPGTGLSAAAIDQIVGKTAKVDIEKDEQIRIEQLADSL